jgi:hypothetical protein
MKKLLTVIVACAVLTLMNSCYKNGYLHIKGIGDLVPPQNATTALLTSQTWVYTEYFEDFSAAQATLVWKRSPQKDSLNLSLNQVKFYPSGVYTEITQTGATLNGSWNYNNGGRGITVVNSEGTFASTIQVLTGDRYEWLAANGTYGVMVPKDQPIDTAGGRMALLTAHNWVYQEYFFDFGNFAPTLVWKNNLPGASFNLSLNVVKFNPDSTYWEIDQNGVQYNGTWSFTNNQTGTTVTNSLGTFISTIELLDTARFEWYDGISHYGEMVPQ